MRIVKVQETATHLTFVCCVCNTSIIDTIAYADLDGEPYKAYLCEKHAKANKSN